MITASYEWPKPRLPTADTICAMKTQPWTPQAPRPRVKRTLAIIAAIAAVHFALMFLATDKTISHNLGRSLTLFGTPPPDTWFTKLVSHTSAVLRQPMEFFLSILPVTAPKNVPIAEEILGWFFYALNSILWGGFIYVVWYGFRLRFQSPPAASQRDGASNAPI